MKPSEYHSNKGWHNWVLYKVNDQFLEKNSNYFVGNLIDLGCGEASFKTISYNTQILILGLIGLKQHIILVQI